MNYLQLIQRLKRESGRSGGPPAGVSVLAGDDINLANWIGDFWLRVQRRRMDWAWMRKTATGALVIDQQGYALADLVAPEVVTAAPLARWHDETDHYAPWLRDTVNGERRALRWLPYEQFEASFIFTAVPSGEPMYWSVAPDKRLLLGPTPNRDDVELTAVYWKAPTGLALDADTPDMPEQFHELLIWGALLDVAQFDAAPEVEVRARRNLRMAWNDLIDDQAPKVGLGGALV